MNWWTHIPHSIDVDNREGYVCVEKEDIRGKINNYEYYSDFTVKLC